LAPPQEIHIPLPPFPFGNHDHLYGDGDSSFLNCSAANAAATDNNLGLEIKMYPADNRQKEPSTIAEIVFASRRDILRNKYEKILTL